MRVGMQWIELGNGRKRSYSAFFRIFSFFMALLVSVAASGVFSPPVYAEDVQQTFEVPVRLMHAYEMDKPSMGNPAMGQTATIVESADGAEITLQFQALDFMDMHGHLLKMYSWDQEPKAQVDASCKEAKVVEEAEDVGLDGKKAKFPAKVVIHRDALREEQIYVRVRVDAMDAISGGDGSGEQNARLVLDYSQAPAALHAADAAQTTTSQQEAVVPAAQDFDLHSLEDGKYLVPIDLWHMYEDRPSMGNNSMNHDALLEVKQGAVTCTFSVHPMAVSGITASLITFQYTDAQGNLQFADIVEKKLQGDKPSQFAFPLSSGASFMHCQVDPNVEAMGNKPVDARLRFYWDKLQKVADDYILHGDTEVQYGDVFTPAIDMTDATTGIRLQAEERVLASGTQLVVQKADENELSEAMQSLLKRNRQKATSYSIHFADAQGQEIQAIREVSLSFPTAEEKAMLYLVQKDGTPNEVKGEWSDGMYTIRTKQVGTFVLATPQASSSLLWMGIGGGLLILILIGLGMKRRKKQCACFLLMLLMTTSVISTAHAQEDASAQASQANSAEDTEQGVLDPAQNVERGAYQIQIFGSYLNPETGKTEDGGTQNADIGEGMVDGVVTPSNPAGGIDSVFGKPKPGEEHYADALLEKRLDGKLFATVRLYLMNFIRFSDADGPFIQVKQEDGSFVPVEYSITKSLSEENGVNYHDFRFEVPTPEFTANVQMYVVPMSRPVKYFIQATQERKAGAGDFMDYFVQEDEDYLGQQSRVHWMIGGGIAIVIVIIGGIFWSRRKKAKGCDQ